MSDLRAYQTPRKDGVALTLTDEIDQDSMQLSGRWIEAQNPVPLKQ